MGIVEKALTNAGFSLQAMIVSDYRIERWAEEVLGYVRFGITVVRIYNFTRSCSEGGIQMCTLIVNRSRLTALPAIAELPSTMFMNFVQDKTIAVLYPNLTLKGVGIFNNDSSNRDNDWFAKTLKDKGGFNHVRSLNEIEGYEQHSCIRSHSCPFRLREEFDGLSALINTGDSAECVVLPEDYPRFSWKLKCASSCTDAGALSQQGLYSYTTARYIVPEGVMEDGRWRNDWFDIDEEDLDSDDDASDFYGNDRIMGDTFFANTASPRQDVLQLPK
ncbi:hypothetical protein NMY22_g3560 [Coprinellus aureogranulatus]|nr:hypothetical protein NMY22_g3560 [Coprinellus aureogranulatus]